MRQPVAQSLSIAHLCVPGESGGLERVVELLSAAQRQRGHQVALVAVLPGEVAEPPLLESARVAGVDVHRVRISSHGYRTEWEAVGTVLAAIRPDIAHTHGYRADLLHAPVAHRLGIPVVTTLHGFTGGDWKNRAYEWVQRRACRRMDGVVAVSRPIADRMRRVGVRPARLSCVPNAFLPAMSVLERSRARSLLGLADDLFIVGWVGRLSREKGADILLDAMVELRDLPVRAAFIGDGPERALLERRAAALGVSDAVCWLGSRREAASVFSAFDLLALTSRSEGSPMVLFEAMAAKVPIVAARIGGVPAMLGKAGARLTAPEAPHEVATAIRESYADPAGAHRRADAASRRLRSQFAISSWVNRYDAVYRRALAGARRA